MKEFIIFTIVIFCTPVFCQDYSCTVAEKLPHVLDRCLGSGCSDIMTDMIVENLTLYQEPSVKSEVVYVVRKCSPIERVSSNEVIHKYGKAKLIKSHLNDKSITFDINVDVTIISKYDEGAFLVCIDGKKYAADFSDKGQKNEIYNYLHVKEISPLKSMSWLKIRHGKHVGYAVADRSNKAFVWSAYDSRRKRCK